jgi:hypothetical protein
MRARIWAILAFVLLSGCANREQQVAEQRAYQLGEQRYNSPEVVAARNAEIEKAKAAQIAQMAAVKAAEEAADDKQCRSYRTAPGSKPYVDCRLALKQSREQQAAQARAQAEGRAAYEQAAAQRQAEMEEARRRCRSRALLIAGAAMMSSNSPYAGVGIGEGINEGATFAQQNGC